MTYRGDLNAFIAVRLQLDAITTVKCEVGFSDAIDDTGAVNVLATPSWTATNAAVWAFDTDDAVTTTWQILGVAAGTAATKNTAATFGTRPTPVAATYETLMIELRDGVAKFRAASAAGDITYESDWMASAITLTTNLTPWVFVQSRAGSAARNCDIDYVAVWQRRVA